MKSIGRDDERLTVEWGTNFNQERTNVGASFNFFQRDRVNSQDDPRWADSDFRDRVEITSLIQLYFAMTAQTLGTGNTTCAPVYRAMVFAM